MAPILTSRSLLGLLLVSLMACLCAGATAVAEIPSAIFDETRLSLHADTLTDEQLLAGFALIKDFLPSGLDPLDVVYAIKNGTELALTSAQVQEVEVARQVTRRAQGTRGVDLTPCQVATASVLVDAVGVLASLWGVSMRLDPSDLSTIQLTYQELESFKGLVDIVGSKSSSLYQKLKSTVALIKGALNMFGIKQIVKWMTSGLSAWQAVKMAVTMSAQILVWFGTDGAALLGELLALGVGLETLVEDAVACKAACASIAPLPLPPAMRLAVIQNAVEDWTSLEVFLIDQTSVPLHRYQNTDLSWSDWLNLAEPIPMTRLSVARNADGRLEAFGLGSNGEAYHTRQDPNGPGGWNGWGSFGGWSSEIAVGANADGRLELVAAGSKNRAYHLWEDSPSSTSWSGWSTLSGEHPMKEFSVTIRPDGFMQVFALDTNQALYYVRQGPNGDGGWESWQSLGGWSSSMVSSTNLDGRLEVFAVGSDNNVFHIWENAPNSNSWSQWSTFFTFKAKQLTATNLADGNIIVFALGMDQAIYYIYEGSNGWTSWTSLGGSASTISSITTADGIVQVYALFSGDKDVNVLQQLNAIDPTGWSDWVPLN